MSIEVPAAMVEAAAQALCEHADQLDGEPVYDDLDDLDRDSYLKAARPALVGALAVCQVREEWGTRPLDGSPDTWRSSRDNAEAWVRKTAGAAHYYGTGSLRCKLIHRVVITTPTEEVAL